MSHQQALPVLTIRNAALFPHVVMQIAIDRAPSLAAVEAALGTEDRLIAVFSQHDPGIESPQREHLYPVGTRAMIKQVAQLPQGVQLILQGLERVSLGEVGRSEPYLEAELGALPMVAGEPTEVEALQRRLLELASRIQQAVQAMPEVEMDEVLAHLEGPMHLVYLLGSMIHLTLEKAQILLQLDSQTEAMRMLARYLQHEVQVLELKHKIADQAQSKIDREQREYLLRQQLRAIREELGEGLPGGSEVEELRRRLERAELPDAVRKESERALRRMVNLSSSAPDFNVTHNYLDFIFELPWAEETEDDLDLAHARQVLEADHYGLEEIKERILEHLAVLKLNPQAKAPILCLVGPPGVGKTSLGSSIARTLGRNFECLSLGGLHEEAELRGHRRTYIGAMPGRILQSIRRAGVKNPLLMLDEVDKVGRDHRGDPAAALLEILDPAQNHAFRDNYLNLPFDLSKVFFITTANALDTLPRPLLDRMEILRLSGYGDEEKLEIARRYLLPRQRAEAGLGERQLEIGDATLARIIRRYTREAGVRELERTLGRLARKLALRSAEGKGETFRLEPADLSGLLGPERISRGEVREQVPPGVAAGLAWTEAGGEVLYVEAVRLAGAEQLTLTGQLGDVMKESARAARSFILSQAATWRLPPSGASLDLEPGGVHIHVPAGAIPKDGPSAGVAMATALASLYSGLPVATGVAMTGEITLSGLVMPVGGVKEKILAARRAGIKRVILPKANEKDLVKLPEKVREEMELQLAENIGDVIRSAIPKLARRLPSSTP